MLYHKLVLTRAPGVDLPSVVSEGEQSCLSIAAFVAELSTADEPSGIVFLQHLKQLSGELAIEQLDQHVRRLSKGAGVFEPELPWD